ncbi:MAG TPA: dihydrolipoamide acetyltransferase family protein, partial [Planctomycetota bacterium]|nr:dihydrolipoamide acetyltransferase family protein [Planctomycetota bacterium]
LRETPFMPTEVKMPQMGESIYEGTVTKWLKKEGEAIKKDEPLYELSTDKVDTEIPSPVSGTLQKIVVQAGQKVPIHTVVAMVDETGSGRSAPAAAPAPAKEEKAPAAGTPEAVKPAKAAAPPAAEPAPAATASHSGDGDRAFASPLVRKIARDEGVDLAQVRGSGPGGRITKEDIEAHLSSRKGGVAVAAAPKPASAPAPAPAKPAGPAPAGSVPMTPMRIKISEHMVRSKATSAHVHTVFEVDLSKISALREKEKDDYERVYNTKLTFTHFFAAAVVHSIREFPIINSSVDGTNIVYKKEVNLGIAVALPEGLIVPVVKRAEEKSFLGLARAINDVADRARNKKLSVDDIQGGTFTITNPGIYGGLFGTPIINQPQVAILGIGGIEKRAVVIGDAIAVRPMCYLVLGFDHRTIDGAVADQFMAHLKKLLQEWNEPIK